MTRTALLLGLVSLAGCADAPPPTVVAPPPATATTASTAPTEAATTAPRPDAAPAPKLPAAIATTKRIRVGSDISYPPLESYEGTKDAKGFDVELCDLLA